MHEGRRGRPWNVVPFATIVRKLLCRWSPSSTPLTRRESSSHSQSPAGRHAVLTLTSHPALPSASTMPLSEAGKRIGHVSVSFDGKLIIWGGYNDERLHRNFPTNELWVYDPLIQKWALWACRTKRTTDLPPGTSGATSCLIGSYMYIFGGYTMFGNVNTTYRINLLPLLSSAVAIDSSENRVLIVEKLDPVNGDEAPIASDKNVSWAHDGRFYVFGGYGNEPERGDHYRRVVQSSCQFLPDPSAPWNNASDSRRGWNNQLACFDPETGLWSYPKATGRWPAPRAAHAAAKLGSRVLLFGGRHDCHRVNDLWQLDMTTMSWTEIKCEGFSPEGRSWHSLTAVSDEEVLLYGGLSNSRQPLSDCYVYNQRLNSWLHVSVRCEPRLWHSAAFSDKDKQIFIYGGGTTDILDHRIKTSTVFTNDLITVRFSPDSLLHLSLESCTASSNLLQSQFHELPHALRNVIYLRLGRSESQAPE